MRLTSGTGSGGAIWATDNSEENLNAEVQQLAGATLKGWYVAKVRVQTQDYAVDTRDYMIDSGKLVAGGFLKSVPKSAFLDNKPSGSANIYSGSYSWYVASQGSARSLFFSFPTVNNTSFQQMYP